MQSQLLRTTAAAIVLFALPLAANAAVQTVRFIGTVNEIDAFDPSSTIAVTSQFSIGDAVQIDVTYETTTPEVGIGINVGEYDDSIIAINGLIGIYAFTLDAGGFTNEIWTINTTSDTDEFRVTANADGAMLGAFFTELNRIIALDEDDEVYPGGVPPLDPIDFGLFETGSGQLRFHDDSYLNPVDIRYAVTSTQIVPEPSSLALLGLGGLLIARRRLTR